MLDPDTMPNVVFVTAYDQYAIQAFEENAFDYVLKPVEQKRLEKCVARLVKTAELKQPVDYSPMIQDKLEHVPCVGHNQSDCHFSYRRGGICFHRHIGGSGKNR
jgi:two-component system LytT family response regulator